MNKPPKSSNMENKIERGDVFQKSKFFFSKHLFMERLLPLKKYKKEAYKDSQNASFVP